jgi:hypothetical protein
MEVDPSPGRLPSHANTASLALVYPARFPNRTSGWQLESEPAQGMQDPRLSIERLSIEIRPYALMQSGAGIASLPIAESE